MEMLCHVASFLPVKDFNSLVRTNKTTRARLCYRYRQPLHVDYSIKYEYDDEKMILTRIFVKLELKTEENTKTIQIMFRQEDQTTSEWSYYETLLAENIDQDSRVEYHSCDIREVLSKRLRSLSEANVIFETLHVKGAHEPEVMDLAIFVMENRMRVIKLELEMAVLGDHHMDLIGVCRPSSLVVLDAFIPPTFHHNPIIQQLTELYIVGDIVKMSENDLSLYYSTRSLDLWKIKGASVQDVKLFIKQWAGSLRTYESLDLFVQIDESEWTWRRMLEELDSWVEVEAVEDGEHLENETWFCLRRIADRS